MTSFILDKNKSAQKLKDYHTSIGLILMTKQIVLTI